MDGDTKCEVLVVGAGPAGAALAYNLAGQGFSTILIDRKSRIDDPVRCAEYVPAGITGIGGFPVQGIQLATESMTTYIDFREAKTIKAPGFMLDRKVFTSRLAGACRERGGIILKSTKAVSFKEEGDSIRTLVVGQGKERCITSRIVVGADGPLSAVGRYIGASNNSFILGLNENIPAEAEEKKRTMVFFSPWVPGGYGWLFPKQDSINLGIGCQRPADRVLEDLDLKGIYRAFKKMLFSIGFIKTPGPSGKIPEGRITAGLIPSAGMAGCTVKRGFVLAGDAAGLSNPVTGAGIYNALLSADIAARRIGEALKKSDISLLGRIGEDYRETFAASLNRAAAKRDEMLSRWPEGTGSRDDFARMVRETWVSFRPYWERRSPDGG